MSEVKHDQEDLQPDPKAQATGEAADAGTEAEPTELKETPLESAERERGEFMANWQRARADYKNLKRRTFEDIQAAVGRERSSLLEELLVVLDYLDMALAAPVEQQEAKNLQVGVQMTRDQLWALLERHKVALIETDGTFDHSRHQAVATVETDEVEAGQIVEVVRRGFTIGEGILRYAQVKVAAAQDDSESDEEQNEDDPGS